MSATAHYSSPDNATGLVAQYELSGYVKLGLLLEAAGRTFSHRPGNPATAGVVRRPSAGNTVGYRLHRPTGQKQNVIPGTLSMAIGYTGLLGRSRVSYLGPSVWWADTVIHNYKSQLARTSLHTRAEADYHTWAELVFIPGQKQIIIPGQN